MEKYNTLGKIGLFPSPMGIEVGLMKVENIAGKACEWFPSPMGIEVGLIK